MSPSDTLPLHGVSVVICCHNSTERLPETLKHLSRQSMPPSIPWEVILVDNASTDYTAVTASRLWGQLGTPVVLRVVNESTPGQACAREAGIRASKHDILVFVDDDNWLAADYLQVAFETMSEHAEIGALGGEITAAFEVTPPGYFRELQAGFAVGPQGNASGDITNYKPHLAGAGIVLRKSAYEELTHRNFQFLLSGRKKNQLNSGEDTELCLALVLLGYRIWYDSRLRLTHFMPVARLSRRYMFRLARGLEASSPVLSCYEAVIRGSGDSAFSVYLQCASKRIVWTIKAVAKLFLNRSSLTAYTIQLVSLGHCLTSLPEVLRVFKRHYPAISKLRRAP